ncbi:MAG: sigma-54 dependent transcriptional regulator [Bacteroidota bacterium]
MENILIIDDDRDICLLLDKFLTKKGFLVQTTSTGQEGIHWLKKNEAAVILCDFKLPDYSGLDILQKIKILHPDAQVIIITGYSDVRIAVEALKKGAFEYVIKPLYPDEILMTITAALKNNVSRERNKPVKRKKHKSPQFIIGPSRQSQTVQKHIDLIAPTDMSVIILGETGTGKEYVAKAIHGKSQRAEGPFVAVDCGALPKDLAGSELFGHVKGAFTGAVQDKKGCFEQADGGTLFLDEIGNLSYDNQIKLLRVLQERKVKRVGGVKEIDVDVRVIIATNENLKRAVQEGEFREDVYHRLNEFNIQLAPLRSRPEDIEAFAKHFLQQSNEQLKKDLQDFDPKILNLLKAYYWHGNLRELSNVVKRAVLLSTGSRVKAEALPEEIKAPGTSSEAGFNITFNGKIPTSLKKVAEAAERAAILEVLKRTNGNKSKTAQLLDVDRKTLYNKLSAYDIST